MFRFWISCAALLLLHARAFANAQFADRLANDPTEGWTILYTILFASILSSVMTLFMLAVVLGGRAHLAEQANAEIPGLLVSLPARFDQVEWRIKHAEDLEHAFKAGELLQSAREKYEEANQLLENRPEESSKNTLIQAYVLLIQAKSLCEKAMNITAP